MHQGNGLCAHLSIVFITLLGPVDFPFKSISMPATAPHQLMALYTIEKSTVTTPSYRKIPVAIHLCDSLRSMICHLKIDESEASAPAAAVPHDHRAGDGPKLAEHSSQRLFIHVAADIPHVHVAKFPRLNRPVLQVRQALDIRLSEVDEARASTAYFKLGSCTLAGMKGPTNSCWPHRSVKFSSSIALVALSGSSYWTNP